MLGASFSVVSTGFGGELRAGAAVTNITTPLGVHIVGNFGPNPALAVHDELHARALVVDDGAKKVAIVVCDLVGIRASVCDEARRRINEETGIPVEHVMVATTHTHSAGNAMGSLLNWFTGAPIDAKTMGRSVEPLDGYQKMVASRIADAVIMADARRRPAEMAFGKVNLPEYVFNRRWTMKEGTMPVNTFGKIDKAKMNPPAGSQNLVEPVGPVDPILSFLAFREPEGALISVYASYSLHYIGGVRKGEISADYFGMFCDALEAMQPQQANPASPSFVAMLSNGTSGDINNVNFRHPDPPLPLYEKMRLVGTDVAEKVNTKLGDVKWTGDVSVDAKFEKIPMKRRAMEAETLEWARATWVAPHQGGKPDLKNSYAGFVLAAEELEQEISVPLQYLRIGTSGIAAMPGEVFAETGLAFKKRAPLPDSFMIGVTNDFLGYLPPPRHYDLGGYETFPGVSHFERDASEVMLDKLLEMAKSSGE